MKRKLQPKNTDKNFYKLRIWDDSSQCYRYCGPNVQFNKTEFQSSFLTRKQLENLLYKASFSNYQWEIVEYIVSPFQIISQEDLQKKTGIPYVPIDGVSFKGNHDS